MVCFATIAHSHPLGVDGCLAFASREPGERDSQNKEKGGETDEHERGGSGVDPRRNPQPVMYGHSPGEDLTERAMPAPERDSYSMTWPMRPSRRPRIKPHIGVAHASAQANTRSPTIGTWTIIRTTANTTATAAINITE